MKKYYSESEGVFTGKQLIKKLADFNFEEGEVIYEIVKKFKIKREADKLTEIT